jgi:hypothetical protein
MCSFLSITGKHLVLLGISGVDDVMTMFTSDDEGNVIMKVRGISANETPSLLTVSRFEMTVRRVRQQECLLHLATTLSPQTLQ